jgi:hypothetical protein
MDHEKRSGGLGVFMVLPVLLAVGVGGFALGRNQGKVTDSTPYIQARVEGGPQCVAHVRYGFAAEKGLTTYNDGSTKYEPGTYTGPKHGEDEAAKGQALLLEYYGLLLDAGFKISDEGKWIKPKRCK